MPGTTYTLGLDSSPAVAGLNAFKGALSTVTSGLALLGIGFGAFKGAQAFTDQLKGVFQAGKELSSLHAITGQSIGDVVGLRKAFEESGLSAGAVSEQIGMLQKSLGGMNEEGQPTAGIFRQIGLSIEGLKGQSAVSQLDQIGAAIRGLGSQEEKVAAARKIFGRGGADMLAVLSDSGAMRSAAEATAAYGAIMERDAGIFKEITNDLGSLSTKVRGFFTGFADQVAPVLAPLLHDLKGFNLTGLGEQLGGAVRALAGAFKQGQITELLSLSVQAGLQMGANTGMQAFTSIASRFGAGLLDTVQFFNAGFNAAAITSGQLIQQELNKAFCSPLEFFQSSWVQALLNPIGFLGQKLTEAAIDFGKVLMAAMKGHPGEALALSKAAAMAANPAGAITALTGDFAGKMKAGAAAGGAPDFMTTFSQQMAALGPTFQEVAKSLKDLLPKGDIFDTGPIKARLEALGKKLAEAFPAPGEFFGPTLAEMHGGKNLQAIAPDKIQPLSDRLSKVGLFIGGNGGVLGERAQQDTARNTGVMAKSMEVLNKHMEELHTELKPRHSSF